MSEAVNALINRLAGRSPRLAALLREHRVENFGDVLPHVFFGDLTRFILREYCRIAGERTVDESAMTSELEGLLEELEGAFASGEDEEVSELIAVSFLENLPGRDEEGQGIRDLLGPTLRTALAKIE
ncbi:MAG: hypothetical protein KY458_07595 [Actinobacteria bacterium]|nr:hypothetical protein [Actinomycetota bacterium]